MKYNEEEIEIIAKSMYKAVKKALGVGSGELQVKARAKSGKDAVDDLMDPNFIAETKENKIPPTKQAQMNKSCDEEKKKGKSRLYKLSDFVDKVKKKRKH